MLRPSKYERGECLTKQGIVGTHNRFSPKHLQRHTTEFDGRDNDSPSDILDQMKGMHRKRLTYDALPSD